MYVWQFDAKVFKYVPIDEAWEENSEIKSQLHNYKIELKDSVSTGKISIVLNGNQIIHKTKMQPIQDHLMSFRKDFGLTPYMISQTPLEIKISKPPKKQSIFTNTSTQDYELDIQGFLFSNIRYHTPTFSKSYCDKIYVEFFSPSFTPATKQDDMLSPSNTNQFSHGSTSETLHYQVNSTVTIDQQKSMIQSHEDEFDFDAFKTNQPSTVVNDIFDFATNAQQEQPLPDQHPKSKKDSSSSSQNYEKSLSEIFEDQINIQDSSKNPTLVNNTGMFDFDDFFFRQKSANTVLQSSGVKEGLTLVNTNQSDKASDTNRSNEQNLLDQMLFGSNLIAPVATTPTNNQVPQCQYQTFQTKSQFMPMPASTFPMMMVQQPNQVIMGVNPNLLMGFNSNLSSCQQQQQTLSQAAFYTRAMTMQTSPPTSLPMSDTNRQYQMQNLIKEINTPQAHNYKQQMMTAPPTSNPHLDKMKNQQAKLQDENSRLDQNLGNLLGKFV